MLTEAQKQLRRSGVGGSDAAAIAGEHPFKGPIDVWLEKVHPDRVSDTAGLAAEIGLFMEPFVRALYQRQTGRPVVVPTETMRDRHEPWVLGNLDGLVTIDDPRGHGVLEIKRPTLWSADKYTDTDYPIQHFIQCQWYMRVGGYEWADLAVLVGDANLRIYRIERDEAFIGDLVETCREWFFRHVEGREQPEVEPGKTARDVLAKLHARNRGDVRPAPAEAATWVAKYFEARDAEKVAADAKEEASNALRALIGDSDGIEAETFRATWRWREPTRVEAYERAGYRHFDCRALDPAKAKPKTSKAAKAA